MFCAKRYNPCWSSLKSVSKGIGLSLLVGDPDWPLECKTNFLIGAECDAGKSERANKDGCTKQSQKDWMPGPRRMT
jgi:hypothetical protein